MMMQERKKKCMHKKIVEKGIGVKTDGGTEWFKVQEKKQLYALWDNIVAGDSDLSSHLDSDSDSDTVRFEFRYG